MSHNLNNPRLEGFEAALPFPGDLDSILKEAASAVFITMFDWPPDFGPCEDSPGDGPERVVGSVGVAGSIEFTVYLHMSAVVARRLTCRLLRMAEAELHDNQTVNDMIGELANMLAGQIKQNAGPAAHACLQTTPTVVRGGGFRVTPPARSVRRSLAFKCRGGGVFLEAVFIPGASANPKTAPAQDIGQSQHVIRQESGGGDARLQRRADA